jgi:hypothetical protein
LRVGVTAPLFPFALLGLALIGRLPGRARAMLFLAIVLTASALALVRLHATGGYCTARHGLVPVMLLTIASAHSIAWLMGKVLNSRRWFNLTGNRVTSGRAAWAAVVALVILMILKTHDLGPLNSGPFSVYQATGEWLARNASNDEQVLDLTGWPLFFSQRSGYNFADVYDAPADARTRWVVVRQPHVAGHWHYSQVLRELLGSREPVALVPPRAHANQVQIRIYDRQAAPPQIAATAAVVR